MVATAGIQTFFLKRGKKLRYHTLGHLVNEFWKMTATKNQGVVGRRSIRVRGCWDGESQEEGNKGPVIHGVGL